MKTLFNTTVKLLFVFIGLSTISESYLCPRHVVTWPKETSVRSGLRAASSPTTPSTKTQLLQLLERTPSNSPTPRSLTDEILDAVRHLELECPTENVEVLEKLSGTWELLWTAQDPESPESNRLFRSWINPLENQSYSNNPRGGRSNPFLPIELQERLEKAGLFTPPADNSTIRSTQTIDPSLQQVRNVVALNTSFLGRRRTFSLTVTVDFWPNPSDPRQIDVKFQSCRISPADVTIPLGVLGPTGWLRTVYIDDNLRITRGHKGSVFVLQRPPSSKR